MCALPPTPQSAEEGISTRLSLSSVCNIFPIFASEEGWRFSTDALITSMRWAAERWARICTAACAAQVGPLRRAAAGSASLGLNCDYRLWLYRIYRMKCEVDTGYVAIQTITAQVRALSRGGLGFKFSPGAWLGEAFYLIARRMQVEPQFKHKYFCFPYKSLVIQLKINSLSYSKIKRWTQS